MNRAYLSLSALVLGTLLFAGAASAPTPNRITFTGTLKTGIMAIGGETTGIEVSHGGTRFELDIKDAATMKKASDLNGKEVEVSGTLTLKQGVESGQRRIISVDSLEAAKAAATAPATAKAPATAPATTKP